MIRASEYEAAMTAFRGRDEWVRERIRTYTTVGMGVLVVLGQPPMPAQRPDRSQRRRRGVPLELVYLGRERRLHLWEATIPTRLNSDGSLRIRVDAIPPRTSIRVRVEHGPR